MIVHSEVYEILSNSTMAQQTNRLSCKYEIDMKEIKQKCHSLLSEIEDYDNELHQYDSKTQKEIHYFFKYLKKNMYLIAAFKRVHKLYEDEMKELFVKFHSEIEVTAKRNIWDRGQLARALSNKIAVQMDKLNPLPRW